MDLLFQVSFCQVVELIIFCIQLPEHSPKCKSANSRENSDGRIVPDEKRVGREAYEHIIESVSAQIQRSGREGLTYKALSDRSSNAIREKEDGQNQRAHVPRRLRKGVFNTGGHN